MCLKMFDQDEEPVRLFLKNNKEVLDDCIKLFNESPKLGVNKLKEYLDDNGLWLTILQRKRILEEMKGKYWNY